MSELHSAIQLSLRKGMLAPSPSPSPHSSPNPSPQPKSNPELKLTRPSVAVFGVTTQGSHSSLLLPRMLACSHAQLEPVFANPAPRTLHSTPCTPPTHNMYPPGGILRPTPRALAFACDIESMPLPYIWVGVYLAPDAQCVCTHGIWCADNTAHMYLWLALQQGVECRVWGRGGCEEVK